MLGTFRTLMGIASSLPEAWASYGTMAADLMRYHASIMKAHPDQRPGQFKTVRNFAGSTAFVAPELVEGTASWSTLA